MTASAPSGAMKHVAKRPSEAKQAIIGQVPVEQPFQADSMANGLGKTATRSKSGCMTCRIRRKKCDLLRTEESCQTCIRLRIGCLGWGAKRPEALRNPAVVKEIQARIKRHLASNNMIKGSARASAAAPPGQHILFFHHSPNHPQFTQSPSHTVHNPFSSTPPQSLHSSSSSDHSVGPFDTSYLSSTHAFPTTAPQPSSTPSDDLPGGAAGGAGASYGGFLSFADLLGPNGSGHGEAPPSGSTTKRRNRQQKHAPSEPLEGDDADATGSDDYDMQPGDRGSDEGGSSFSRHPPGYPQPNYDPPQYNRNRYSYDMGSPPQPAPYHTHAPRPFAQSDLRTRSYEYDHERSMRVDGELRTAERDREYHSQMHPQGLPRAGYDQSPSHPPFPSSHFVYGPGVGIASAGRALGSYNHYGHMGYRGPSGPPPPKMDPLYSGPRLVMDPRASSASNLPGPPLTFSMAQRSGGSPPSDQYLQPMEHSTNGNAYNDSGYRSPNPQPSLSPMGAGMSSSRDTLSNGQTEPPEEAADVDGEPMSTAQLSATNNAPPLVGNAIQQAGFTTNPYIPHSSSFGPHYTYDSTVQDGELDGALVPPASNAMVVQQKFPMDPDLFTSLLSGWKILTMADVPGAIEANANTTNFDEIAAIQQLRVGIAPPPPIDAQPMYTTQLETQYLQFSTRQMELLDLYRKDLCNLQYHIAHSADSSIAQELFDLAMQSEAALFGTLTLTSLYMIRLRGLPEPPAEEASEVRGFKDKVSTALLRKKDSSSLDSGDAMAALHMVSAVLFEGGTDAQWDQFLDVAKCYVAHHPVVTMKSWHSSPVMDGSNMDGRTNNASTTTVDKKNQFIIKTVAWFDVIGSVTMRRDPYFLDTYRELFGRQGGAAMERIMGCNEKVLLAIAETAALAAWRREEANQGTLNYMELAQRAAKIQEILQFVGPQYIGTGVDDSSTTEQERQARTVRLVSNVFRATGQLYLHTVVSGCNPDVHDIKTAVQATVAAFQVLQASDFDRSLVFPITLAGCMTDNREHRSYLEARLLRLGPKGQAVGNTSSCLQLMKRVWTKRDAQLSGRSKIVDWIDEMDKMGWKLLLV